MENGEPAYLAGKSGIENVREIVAETKGKEFQMYEQRNKNINKASADTMYSITKALGCTIEDLIER